MRSGLVTGADSPEIDDAEFFAPMSHDSIPADQPDEAPAHDAPPPADDGQAIHADLPDGDEAGEEPERIDEAWAARLRRGNAIIRRLLGPKALGQPRQPQKRTLIVAPAESGAACRRVVVCFNGNVGTIRQPDALQAYPDVHVIALRDPERRFSLTGVEGVGGSMAAVTKAIEQIAGALGGDEMYCFGASAGGYPALRYALELRVRGALLFSPPTTLNLDDDPGAPMSKYPQLARLYSRARDLAVDLAPLYGAMPERPSVLLLYSPLHPRDTWLAERMRGLGGAELIPLHGCTGHSTLNYVIRKNRLRHYFDRLFELSPHRV